uniref:Uncharacterized protein n=1 Tax=Cacopsylla melanoneura TaxID=428564 RepID=A0A8D8WYX9_9HEMI
MVTSNKLSFGFLHYFYFVYFIPAIVLAHYPDQSEKDNPKPCSHKNVAINYQAPICVPTDQGWTAVSEQNCLNGLKSQCPEFNQAVCLWYSWKPSCTSLNVPELQLPCCRLKYYASSGGFSQYTWMEVYYTNQYGTADRNNTVFDIVEIHRLIKHRAGFGNNDQPDWPLNVFDPNGERGLKWVYLNTSKTVPLTGSKLCPDNKDEGGLCSGKTVDFLKTNFKEGFDPAKTPTPSEKETNHNASISYEYTAGCVFGLIDQLKTSVCKVTYHRRSFYKNTYTTGQAVTHTYYAGQNVTVPYLEAQVYSDSKGGKDGLVRYAYLQYVDVAQF